MGDPPTAAPAAAAIDVQREEEISRAWRGARPLRDSPLQFDDAPGAKDGERHLISGPSPPYLSDLLEARLGLELNAHGGEDDVAAEREALPSSRATARLARGARRPRRATSWPPPRRGIRTTEGS